MGVYVCASHCCIPGAAAASALRWPAPTQRNRMWHGDRAIPKLVHPYCLQVCTNHHKYFHVCKCGNSQFCAAVTLAWSTDSTLRSHRFITSSSPQSGILYTYLYWSNIIHPRFTFSNNESSISSHICCHVHQRSACQCCTYHSCSNSSYARCSSASIWSAMDSRLGAA